MTEIFENLIKKINILPKSEGNSLGEDNPPPQSINNSVVPENNGKPPSSANPYHLVGIAIVIICVALAVAYYFISRAPLTGDKLWSDFLLVLPYGIVGSISFVFAFLDLYEKFPDFGVGLPLTSKFGWAHLLFNTVTPMVLLYGYLNYFPSIGIPKIGAPDDIWLPSFVVALAFPLLIRSKFFTYTNASGDNVSVGFDQLYDRLVEFFVRNMLFSTKAQEKRRDLVQKCSDVYKNLLDLKKEAYLLILNHTDWNEDRKNKEREKIDKYISDNAKDQVLAKYHIASYILQTNGEDYLRDIMVQKDPNEKGTIEELVNNYKASLGRSLTFALSR